MEGEVSVAESEVQQRCRVSSGYLAGTTEQKETMAEVR